MNERDDGGPAFPREDYQGGGMGQTGMSVRDYFAIEALGGLLASADGGEENSINDKAFARAAYQLADAMLAERRRTS